MIDFKIDDNIIQDALEDTILAVAERQLELLEEEVWPWPRDTLRKNKDIVDSPRDIVDLEELKNSFELVADSATEWRYIYYAEHALYVHEGAILSNGTELPARPWITRAIEEVSPYDRFGEILMDEL
jgi:hypothetical protein